MLSKSQFLLIAMLFTAIAVGTAALILNKVQAQIFERETQNRVELVLQFSKAVRAYTKETLRPAVQEKTDDMVFEAMSSSFVTQGIIDNFRKNMPQYIYRQATHDPLNLNSKADPYEEQIIEAFKSDPSLQEVSGYRKTDDLEYYSVARPIVVESKCLQCHGSVENVRQTQPEIIQRYGTSHGYDWIVGDTVAAQIVQIPTDDLRTQSASLKNALMGILGTLVLILVSASYFFFNRALKQHEEAIEARKQAELANKTKTDFLANMSHEIRTPMTAILGFADTIRETGDLSKAPKQRIDAVETIKRNGEHLLTIVNDILDISKIEAGKLDIEKIDCSPLQIVAEVQSLMNVRAKAKGLDLDLMFEGGLPENIQTDPTRLRQILINIVGNAIKFTPKGSVKIITSFIRSDEEEKSLIQFDIIDTGIGIPKEQVTKLFQAFSQAESSTTRKFGGSGLGLTISKHLAIMLGGDLSIIPNQSQKGSTFRVQIQTGPLKDVEILDDPAAALLAQPAQNIQIPSNLENINARVLLAEDGPDNQRLIAFVLKKADIQVTIVDNGKLAMEVALEAKAQGNPFDVILMDMQMPVMDGYTATTRLRQQQYTGPIIALTAHAMDSDRAKCVAAGCDDFATKPINKPVLLNLIAQYTRKSREAA